MSPSRCVILVPFATHVAPACEQGLIELQRRGYDVRRVGGYAAIDQGRNQMATDALAAGFEETFWIDADIDFQPDAVERCGPTACRSPAAFTPARAARALGSQTLPGTAKLGVGKGGGLCEILYAGAGFLHVRREVYRTIQERLVCRPERAFRTADGSLFPADGATSDAGPWYLSEDYAFCERARQCGFKIMADTSIRLWHIGEYAYGWEDAGLDRPRHDSFLFLIADEKQAGAATPSASRGW